VQYPGLKEEYYLADFEPDPTILPQLGLDGDRRLVVVRTAPSYALYLGGSENELLTRLLQRLAAEKDVQTVVLARTDEQRRAVRSLGSFVVPERAIDGRSLVAFADVVVSAGGTMIREAAVLGTPVWSIFEGRLGAVDEQLAREGRIRFLRAPSELVVEKIRERPERVRRDPAALLRLAVPA
jgi:predicted glycosyltransferase